jgi:alpha-1,6-mannosyltransferase
VIAASGLLAAACFVGMALLHDLLCYLIPFLVLYGLACLGYGVAVSRLLRGPEQGGTLPIIVCLAILFRVALLFTTPPTLSTDVYRYIWDGRMTNAGINPYAHRIDSPLLDAFDSPQRALVNHSEMATPYLPAAQVFFAAVYRIAPDSPLAFQIAAILLDLITGWLVIDLLRRLGRPRTWGLIYLWNPLVVVEFANGAHVDALMICLMMVTLWTLVAVRPRALSVVALAAAALTKGLPALLLPVVWRRWGWRYTVAFAALAIVACIPFAPGAGWGLAGPLDGEGLFGALRIYAAGWNFNGGLYPLLEVVLSGQWIPEAVRPGVASSVLTWAAKLTVTILLGLVLLAVWLKGRRYNDNLALLRLAIIPLAAYLLLTTTVHPWYVTLIMPLLPFLPAKEGEAARTGRFLLPWLTFSAAVALSYLTYLDPANLRETILVGLAEYVPLYLLLLWSAWPASGGAEGPGRG